MRYTLLEQLKDHERKTHEVNLMLELNTKAKKGLLSSLTSLKLTIMALKPEELTLDVVQFLVCLSNPTLIEALHHNKDGLEDEAKSKRAQELTSIAIRSKTSRWRPPTHP